MNMRTAAYFEYHPDNDNVAQLFAFNNFWTKMEQQCVYGTEE